MTKEQLAGAAVALALVVGVVVLQKDAPPVLDVGPARLVRALDGGKAYVVESAGQTVLLDAAPCVRRRKGSAPGSCLMRFDGRDLDQGELSRFPASVASGPDCEPVACAVLAGEDADALEADVLDKVQRIEAPKAVVEEVLP